MRQAAHKAQRRTANRPGLADVLNHARRYTPQAQSDEQDPWKPLDARGNNPGGERSMGGSDRRARRIASGGGAADPGGLGWVISDSRNMCSPMLLVHNVIALSIRAEDGRESTDRSGCGDRRAAAIAGGV